MSRPRFDPIDATHRFVVDNRSSVWLSFMVLVLAATMMHPTFASLLDIFAIGMVLVALRWCAHLEGQHQAHERQSLAQRESLAQKETSHGSR